MKGKFDMINELTEKDFESAVKNPHFDKLCRKVEVVIKHEDYEVFLETAKLNGERVKPEDVMKRCLADYAKILREHE